MYTLKKPQIRTLVLYIFWNLIILSKFLIFEQLKIFMLNCILIKFALHLFPSLFLGVHLIHSSSFQLDYHDDSKNFA